MAKRNKWLRPLGWIAQFFIWLVFMVDRALCSFMWWQNLCSFEELKAFEHERTALAQRYVIYLLILALWGLYGFITYLIYGL